MDSMLSGLKQYLILGLVFGVVVYIYLGITLSIIARKTGAAGAAMAWVPILNMLLMCRIARKSGLFFFLLFVPFVNLIVFAMVWMSIARVRGKSPVLGLLIVLPPINLLVPALMASGPPDGVAHLAVTTTAAPALAVCPACGRPECVSDLNEEFCGFTGQRIRPAPVAVAADAADPAAAGAPGMTARVLAGALVLAVVVFLGFGLFSRMGKMFGRSGASPHPGAAGGITRRLAGTLTEFPVDTGGSRPTSVATRDLRATSNVQLPPQSLPPGLPAQQLSRIGKTMTSATYQTKPADPSVRVHVFETDAGSSLKSEEIARDVNAASGPAAEMSGIRVQSPAGAEYRGFRVRTPDSVTYVMDKVGAPIVILIYAPDPSIKEVADRLAADVGNGNGLADDPAMQTALDTMPADVPGFVLLEANAYSGSDLLTPLQQAGISASGTDSRDAIEKIRVLLPSRYTVSRYGLAALSSAPVQPEYKMILGDYGGSIRAQAAWVALGSALKGAGMRPVTFSGGDALTTVDQAGMEYLLFRRGSSIGAIAATSSQSDFTMRLAQSVGQ